MKATVYRLKEGIDLNKLSDLGFDIIPSEPIILVKIVPQDFDGELCQGTLQNIYNNSEWRAKFYDMNRKEVSKTLDLHYRNGKAKITEKFRHVLTDWRIQIELSDGWLGFTPLDPYERRVYFSSNHLDTYCADEIKKMLDMDLIELFEVEEGEPNA